MEKLYKSGIILFLAMLLSGLSSSQATELPDDKGILDLKVQLRLNEVSLEKVLDHIAIATEIEFLYSPQRIDSDRKITVNANNESLGALLNRLLEGLNIGFELVEGTSQILLFRQERIARLTTSAQKIDTRPLNLYPIERPVSGTVTGVNGESLVGVNIVIKNKPGVGTVTDFDGRYSLEIPDGAVTLVFSYIGYETQEITIAGQQVVDLVMKENISRLNEIVVVGYGAVNKKDLTGAVVALNTNEMTTGGNVASVAQMLQGRAAGVEVTTESSEPGADLSVVIRGLTSIGNTNQPLYVVDGFPMRAGVSLNPSDIERVDILKDASATAIYGSRGSAGVILITTKKGKSGKVQVTYNGYAGVQQINNTIDFLNWNDYSKAYNIRWAESTSYDGVPFFSAADLASGTAAVGEGTNWLDEGTRSAPIQNHHLSVSGGNDKTRYSLSGNYFSQDGILLNSRYNRGSIRLNFDTRIGEKANIGANIYTQQTKANAQKLWPGARNSSVMYKLLTANPGRPAYNADGSLGQVEFSRDNSPWINPIGQLTIPDRDVSGSRTYVNIWADYEIVDGLVAKLNVGNDQSTETNSTYVPGIYTGEYVPESQQAEIGESKFKNSLIEGTLTYKSDFSDNHSLTVLGGASTQYFDTYGFSAKGIGYPTDKTLYYNLGSAAKGTTIGSSRKESRLISFFVRANYIFNDKYLFTSTIRSDGDSKFGSNNKWGIFPSASVAWRISEESFLNTSDLVDNLKLRVGYGVTGNNSFGAYTALARIGASGPYTFDGTSVVTGLGASGNFAPNPNLRWETSTMLNVGIDFGLWRSRLFGSIEIYNTDTRDLIIDKNISKASTGYTKIRANVGEINNKGMEITLGSDIIDKNNFTWTFSANASKNINKVIKLDGDNIISVSSSKAPHGGHGDVYTRIVPGEPIGNFYGYIYKGVLSKGEIYDPQPASTIPGSALYEDLDNSGLIDSDDRTILGNSIPDFIYGFNNRLSYRGFGLGLFFQGVYGNDIFNVRRVIIDEENTPASLERYNSNNTKGTLPGEGYFYEGSYGSYVNNLFIEDGSYLRLKNVEFTYKFNTRNVSRLGNVELYISGQNLLTWTEYSGFDPDVSFVEKDNANNGIGRGVDDNGYPNVRTYTGGLRITF